MLNTDFGGDLLLPFAILGFVMTVGYVVWSWQRAKAKRGNAEDFVPVAKHNTLEDELRSELDAIRDDPSEESEDEDVALDLPPEERERQQRIRAMAEDDAGKDQLQGREDAE